MVLNDSSLSNEYLIAINNNLDIYFEQTEGFLESIRE